MKIKSRMALGFARFVLKTHIQTLVGWNCDALQRLTRAKATGSTKWNPSCLLQRPDWQSALHHLVIPRQRRLPLVPAMTGWTVAAQWRLS